MYYITFRAKDEKPGSRSQNFQTRVYAAAAKGKIEVKLCRLEQKKSTRRYLCFVFWQLFVNVAIADGFVLHFFFFFAAFEYIPLQNFGSSPFLY